MARQLNLPSEDPAMLLLRKEVADSLASAIAVNGLTKTEAAQKLGVSRTALFAYLNKKATIGVLPLLRAIEHLGIVLKIEGKTIRFDSD